MKTETELKVLSILHFYIEYGILNACHLCELSLESVQVMWDMMGKRRKMVLCHIRDFESIGADIAAGKQ